MTGKRAMENRVFSFIRYANAWEDADVMLEGLGRKVGQTGAMVCSGGDNVLAMLIRRPEKIYAFDVNKTQLFCTELKIAAIRTLSLEETKCLLGVTEGKRLKLYDRVKGEMSEEAQEYFARHRDLIARGIIHAGKFEHYLQMFRKYVIPLTSSRKNYAEFARMNNLEAQKEFYSCKIDTRRFRMLFRIFFGCKMMAKLGRDESFFAELDQGDKETQSADLKKKVEYGILHTYNNKNPYLDYLANGNFTHAFPHYLRPEFYGKIRDNLDKIELVRGDITGLPDEKFDFMYLSDIFEYMNEQEFCENIEEIKLRMRNGGKILYWNMQNRHYIRDQRFVLEEELAQELFDQNQAWFYRDLLIYEAKR